MLRTISMVTLILMGFTGVARAGEEKKGGVASEATCGATPPSGERNSKTSDWTKFSVPEGFIINKEKTKVDIESERGSEHTYIVAYEDSVEIIAGTGIKQPTTIKVQTHSRSEKGAGGGGGNMKVKVTFFYVKYKYTPRGSELRFPN